MTIEKAFMISHLANIRLSLDWMLVPNRLTLDAPIVQRNLTDALESLSQLDKAVEEL